MPCQHLTELQELKLPMSNSDLLKVLCPIFGKIDVCAYTHVSDEKELNSQAERATTCSTTLPPVPESK